MKHLMITAGIFLAELFLKGSVEKNWPMHRDKSVLKGALRLRRYHNRGAFLNFGEKNTALVAAVSVGLTAGLFVYSLLTFFQGGNRGLKAGLSLLLGGAFSNTYDRLHRKYVVDYFSFHTGIKAFDRIVFNLADFAIMAGVMLCVIANGG